MPFSLAQLLASPVARTGVAFFLGATLVGALWWVQAPTDAVDDAAMEALAPSTARSEDVPGLRYAVRHPEGDFSFPTLCGSSPRWIGYELGCARVRPAMSEEGGLLGVLVTDPSDCHLCTALGLRSGDVVTHVSSWETDGLDAPLSSTLFSTWDLQRWRARLMAPPPHGKITLRVIRDGRPAFLTRTLGLGGATAP